MFFPFNPSNLSLLGSSLGKLKSPTIIKENLFLYFLGIELAKSIILSTPKSYE